MNKTIQSLKNRKRNNKEITKVDNAGDRKPRKQIRCHRYKHHQQNTRYRREISGAEDTIENIDRTIQENTESKKL